MFNFCVPFTPCYTAHRNIEVSKFRTLPEFSRSHEHQQTNRALHVTFRPASPVTMMPRDNTCSSHGSVSEVPLAPLLLVFSPERLSCREERLSCRWQATNPTRRHWALGTAKTTSEFVEQLHVCVKASGSLDICSVLLTLPDPRPHRQRRPQEQGCLKYY
jgi:hypothetical protein